MKKSLMALAVLGAMSSVATAQSSVTLYGIVDVGVQWNEQGIAQTGNTTQPYKQDSTFGVNSGYQSGSRFGLRGSEALGRGWNAVFTLEGGYDVDTGMSGQGGRLFGRQAWAGLQHSAAGTFVLGRVATVSSGTGSFDLFASGAGIDPFSTGWGINGLNSTFIPSAALREDNSILWQSPRWAGFQFGANYSFNINGQELTPSGNNTNGLTIGGNWMRGPFAVAVTYDVLEAPDTAPAGTDDQKMLQLGATFDFKIVKLHAAYATQDNISIVNTATIGTFRPTGLIGYDNQAYMFGVTVPLFGGKILASYQYSDADNVSTPTYSFEPDYSVWGIGYEYPFSRRTNMYIGYGQAEWDGTVSATVQATSPSERLDRKQFALGIRHLF